MAWQTDLTPPTSNPLNHQLGQGGAITFGAVTYAWIAPQIQVELEGLAASDYERSGPVIVEDEQAVIAAGVRDAFARNVPSIPLDTACSLLENRSSMTIGENVIGHECQLPSNMPCEDTSNTVSYGSYSNDERWTVFSIFDGHAGPRTSELLRTMLPAQLGKDFGDAGYLDNPLAVTARAIAATIKRTFLYVDRMIVESVSDSLLVDGVLTKDAVAAAAPAFSGSCALLAIFHSNQSVLRVANVGDSRAVLGRWDDEAQTYVTMPLSTDHKGFDKDEVERIRREHPGEDVVDPKTGRVHGIAVTRAFGDSRWKWTEAVTQRANELLWGPAPLKGHVIKTPPYLTAEPDVTETKLQTGTNPDFAILASDGLWDIMSSEDAVECVKMWLVKNRSTDIIDGPQRFVEWRAPTMASSPMLDMADNDNIDDTYYDEDEQCLKWRVSPKHFVVEDANCATHLIKNALGGTRRNLFTSVMSVQPPLSRNMRDDITVQVLFFGVGPQKELERRLEQGNQRALQIARMGKDLPQRDPRI